MARPVAARASRSWTPRDLPSDWTARRSYVRHLYRDRCAMCSNSTDTHGNGQCDHIAANDDHRISNLRWLCSSCHSKRTQAQALAGRTGTHVCRQCPGTIPPRTGRGRPAAYCSRTCRRAARSAEDRAQRRATEDFAVYRRAALMASVTLPEASGVLDRAFEARRILRETAPTALQQAEAEAEKDAIVAAESATLARMQTRRLNGW